MRPDIDSLWKDCVPAVDCIGRSHDGFHLTGSECLSCGERFLGPQIDCLKCYARRAMKPVELGSTGRLYSYTIVHRSFPGVAVPFVMAVVRLDDGPAIRGTLTGIAPAPEAIRYDMPVRVEFLAADGQKDAENRPYVAYQFAAASGEAL